MATNDDSMVRQTALGSLKSDLFEGPDEVAGLDRLPTEALKLLVDHCTLKRFVRGRTRDQLVKDGDLNLANQLDVRVHQSLLGLSALDTRHLVNWAMTLAEKDIRLGLLGAMPSESADQT